MAVWQWFNWWLLCSPLNEVDGGILVSPCPSVHMWTESCPLCIFYNIHGIDCMFTYLIKQLQMVSSVYVFLQLNNLTFSQILEICNFDFLLLWLGNQYELVSSMSLGSNMNWPIVWVTIERRGVSSERRRSSCSSCNCFTIPASKSRSNMNNTELFRMNTRSILH